MLVTPIPYVIPEENWCSFLKKYDWVTDCRLYYNVKQKKTFDEVITEKLGNKPNSTERLQYYGLLVGTDGTASMHGNHQTLHNLLPGATVRDYSLKRQFGYEMTGWNNESDGLYGCLASAKHDNQNVTVGYDENCDNGDHFFIKLNGLDLGDIPMKTVFDALAATKKASWISNRALRLATGCSPDTADRILILFENAGYISEKNSNSRHKVYIKKVDLEKLI